MTSSFFGEGDVPPKLSDTSDDDAQDTAAPEPAAAPTKRASRVATAKRPERASAPASDDDTDRGPLLSASKPRTAKAKATKGDGTNPYNLAYRPDPDSPQASHGKDSGVRISAGCRTLVNRAQMAWSFEHVDELDYQPTPAAFVEGLLRLGMKHMDDPELIELIPADRRRR